MSNTNPAQGRVIVLGSINVDLMIQVDRLPCAGETVHSNGLIRQLGGKGANQAVGAARAGAACTLLAAVGNDTDGYAMVAQLQDYGVDTTFIGRTAAPTGCAMVATSAVDNQIIVVGGANETVTPAQIGNMEIRAQDICVAQMETPLAATLAFFEKAKAAGATTLFNPAPASIDALEALPVTDILVVNESELRLLSRTVSDIELSDTEIMTLCRVLGKNVRDIIVTLGGEGVALAHSDRITRIAAHRVSVVDTTGAGDCFCGYLAAALARGDTLDSSAIEANAAASIAVQALGAASSIPSLAETRATLNKESAN